MIMIYGIPTHMGHWRRLESPLDSTESEPVNPTGNQP